MKRRTFLQGGLSAVAFGASTIAQAQTASQLGIRSWSSLLMCRRPVKVRRNIYELYQEAPNHPIIAAYRNGVREMMTRSASDPTSWAYQANIHGTTMSPALWPAGAPFASCEHGTQFFLAWHRMYLYYFERILRRASGNPDFALPYWDWGTNRRLPPPFRTPMIGTNPNPLYDGSRMAGINNGDPMPASAVDASPDLAQSNYFGFQSGVEGTPHGTIHNTIGGNMGSFAGAGHDPIFWLHHCNIDRLWEVWLYTGSGHTNPVNNAGWMNQSFTFATETGALVSHYGSEIVDTQTQLRYVYEHTCTSILSLIATNALIPRRQLLASHQIADQVSLSGNAVRLKLRQENSAERERLTRSLALLVQPQEDVRGLLVFDGIRTEAPANGYLEVYIGLPEKTAPTADNPYYAGNIDLFGADAESRRTMKLRDPNSRAEHRLRREIDVTETLRRIYSELAVGKQGLPVMLVPAGMAPPGKAFSLNPKANLVIDAVSLSIVKQSR